MLVLFPKKLFDIPRTNRQKLIGIVLQRERGRENLTTIDSPSFGNTEKFVPKKLAERDD
jgi:hypothetical protein